MAKKWTYGGSWEKYPIKRGEIWRAGDNFVAVADIISDPFPEFGVSCDITYVDPPWNQSNISSFYTKAGKEKKGEFTKLIDKLMFLTRALTPRANFMEMGKQNIEFLREKISEYGGVVTNVWDITYYGKKPCYLVRYTFSGSHYPSHSLNGLDDEQTPFAVIEAEKPTRVLDPCCGRGLTGRASEAHNASFVGVELNERRVSNLLECYAQKGLSIERIK